MIPDKNKYFTVFQTKHARVSDPIISFERALGATELLEQLS